VQAFSPLADEVFASPNARLDRILFSIGEEVRRGRYFPRRYARRGVLPDVVLVVPTAAVFELVGSGADGEALLYSTSVMLISRGVHPAPIESAYWEIGPKPVDRGIRWSQQLVDRR